MAEKTVLIVDDDDIIIRILENILATEYNVATALSAEEAYAKFEETHPDIIISDYMMPKINGFAMMDEMRKRFGEDVYSIFLTSDDQQDTEFAVFRHGAIDFIRKPIKAAEILEAVKRGLDKLDEMKK